MSEMKEICSDTILFLLFYCIPNTLIVIRLWQQGFIKSSKYSMINDLKRHDQKAEVKKGHPNLVDCVRVYNKQSLCPGLHQQPPTLHVLQVSRQSWCTTHPYLNTNGVSIPLTQLAKNPNYMKSRQTSNWDGKYKWKVRGPTKVILCCKILYSTSVWPGL